MIRPALSCQVTGAASDALDRYPHWGTIPGEEAGGCFHQWAFGAGMGYTDFAYSDLTLSTPSLRLSRPGLLLD